MLKARIRQCPENSAFSCRTFLFINLKKLIKVLHLTLSQNCSFLQLTLYRSESWWFLLSIINLRLQFFFCPVFWAKQKVSCICIRFFTQNFLNKKKLCLEGIAGIAVGQYAWIPKAFLSSWVCTYQYCSFLHLKQIPNDLPNQDIWFNGESVPQKSFDQCFS